MRSLLPSSRPITDARSRNASKQSITLYSSWSRLDLRYWGNSHETSFTILGLGKRFDRENSQVRSRGANRCTAKLPRRQIERGIGLAGFVGNGGGGSPTKSKQVLSALRQGAISSLPAGCAVGCGKSKLHLGICKYEVSPPGHLQGFGVSISVQTGEI